MQVTTLGLSINTKWPASIKQFLSFLSHTCGVLLSCTDGDVSIDLVVATTSGTYYAPLECTFKENLQDREEGPDTIKALWLRVFLPFCFWSVIIIGRPLIHHLLNRYQRRTAQGSKRTSIQNTNKGAATNSAGDGDVPRTTYIIVVTLVIFYFSFIDFASEFMKAVNCISMDDNAPDPPNEYDGYALATNSVWGEDTSLECFEGRHIVTGIFGIFGLCVLGMLIGLMIARIWINQKRMRNKDPPNSDLPNKANRPITEDPNFIARYGFIYQGYRHEGLAMCWEAIITMRKGLVVAAVIFASRKGPNLQAALGLGVLIVAVTMHWLVMPYMVYEPEHPNAPNYAESLYIRPDSSSASVIQNSGPSRTVYAILYDQWVKWQNRISHNTLEAGSLLMSISIFYSAIVFGDSGTTSAGKVTLATVVFILNMLYVVYVLYRLYAGLQLALDMHFVFIEASPDFAELEITFPKGGGPLTLIHKIVAAFKFQRHHGDLVQKHTMREFSETDQRSIEMESGTQTSRQE